MTTRKRLLDALHAGRDPFDSVPVEWLGWADPVDEWDSHHVWFDEALAAYTPDVVIEVGSFLGASARHFAARLKEQGRGGQVICCDTWLAERTLWTVPEWRLRMRFEVGRPTFYRTFVANAVMAELEGHIVPVTMDSRNAARYLSMKGITAPVIYIDAGHDYEDCLADLRLYWPLLRPGGVMIIDDYEHRDWPGIRQATHEHAAAVGAQVETNGIKARLRKGA